jgi:hypothetical protein
VSPLFTDAGSRSKNHDWTSLTVRLTTKCRAENHERRNKMTSSVGRESLIDLGKRQ